MSRFHWIRLTRQLTSALCTRTSFIPCTYLLPLPPLSCFKLSALRLTVVTPLNMAFAFAPPMPNSPRPAENMEDDEFVVVDEEETETLEADGTGDSRRS